MKEKLAYFISQFRQRSGEHEQSLLRVFFTSIMFLYLLIQFWRVGADTIPLDTVYIMGASVIASVLMLLVVVWSANTSRSRQWFAMFADIAATSYVMATTQEFGTVFFGVYLWVITGNCLRYGIPSLLGTYFASLIGFGMVLRFNEYWVDHTQLATGLMITLAAVPLYILKLRNQLNKALENTREANEAKSQFLAHMSHEMRTPLNGLIGASDLLTATPLNNEQRELVNTLTNSSRILRQLINNVLDLSKIESGKLASEEIDFDLHELINSSVDMFLPQAGAKGLHLNARCSPDTAFALRGDALHLLQVIINLLGNAIKFTDKGSVELRVSTVRQDPQSALIKFEIIDTGIGIPAEAQKSIFEQFTQADSSITRKYGGTGLGTTISRDLVHLMGGQMGLHSEPGIGSIFWFELPFYKQASSTPDPELTTLDQLRVISIGMSSGESSALASYLAGWRIRFEHEESLPHLMARLTLLKSSHQKGIIVMCSPHSIGMTPGEFARIALDGNDHNTLSLMLLNHDAQQESDEDILAMGYACRIRFPLDKTLLFNALHGVMTPRPVSGVISFKEHYERSNRDRRGVRILLADDNGTNRTIISKILEHGGHKVELAEDGDVALDKLEQKHYDLIILDMNMPQMGGLDVLRIHRATSGYFSHTPVIILTANATIEARQECEDAGVEAYLTKPVDAVTLLDTVSRLTSTVSSFDATELVPLAETGESANHTGVINENALHQLTLLGQGKDNFLHLVIYGFISETEKLLVDMRAAVASRDHTALKELAHVIKGSAGNVGAEALHQLCGSIMQSSDAELLSSANEQFRQVENCFKATRVMLLHHLGASARASV